MQDEGEGCRDYIWYKEKLMIVEKGDKQGKELEESEWNENAMCREDGQEQRR